jgi:glycine cleavage system H lipoate-binding protein
VNSDPYGGWLMKVRLDDGAAEPAGLMTADEYAELTKEQ